MSKQNHPFHLVEKSPWPLFSSISALMMVLGMVKWFKMFKLDIMLMGLIMILLISSQWWRDVTREATFQGLHSKKVKNGMMWGMILFITSEVLFFFSFFWAFFHSSLSPTLELGSSWPPSGICAFDPFSIPLLNTMILLSSGVTVTWSHNCSMKNKFSETNYSLIMTIILGVYFTFLQAMEYMEASFSIADSVYGSTFFLATGFHGLHVIIGSLLLIVMFFRNTSNHFSMNHHMGFEAAIWYWHFVDVVWLFLYSFVYWWSF